ncbi:collagen-binding domain-containing protein [Microbacterium sp. NC79]|uniref:collagen-binding domain-containing protein n=1 Tax=Microbacterium sp. NC79 TaxID=2851009 RepID=UPI001C2C5F7A|nr:collagen-binding domain-containing protein [Microbacterium sp. NC79]MBV0895931.1 hypothetical protein [Microbacterium sp. NC79]
MRRTRSTQARGRTLIGAGVATLFIGSLAVAGSPAAVAAPTAFNPFSINNGFTVVAQGDATLNNGEVEGSVAAFGTLQSGNQNGYPVIHKAAGLADYTVPTIDGVPVHLLATEFVAAGSFDLSNRDDSHSIASDSPEALATAKFVSIDGLTGSNRGGGNAGGDFLRVTNAEGGNLDLKAVPFAGASVSDLKTTESSVAAYFADPVAHITATNACLASMYSPELR